MKEELELTPSEYHVLLRHDLYTFMVRCFAHLYPSTVFMPNWHLELMAGRLAECMSGKRRRLIINVPPRHLKSLLASVALPAFILGHDPSAQIICISYAMELSEKLARDCRSIMTSSWYKLLFPETRLSSPRPAVQELITTRHGSRLGTSVGGVLTGRGCDLMIIDDAAKPEEAVSEPQRKKVNEWFDGTALSRLNSKQDSRIVIISQRLHEDDLAGHVMEQGGWDVLRLAAIAECDEEYELETLGYQRLLTRRAGEPLHAAREPRPVLDRIRGSLGEFNFACQYQQAPIPLTGGLVKRDWLRDYGPHELPERFDLIVQSWDTANKPTEFSDFSVCTTWGVKAPRIYLRHVLRRRMDYPELKRAVRAQAEAFKATTVLIEDRASGIQLIQECIAEGVHAIKRYVPEGDKQMRLYAQTATIENGFVYVPREAPWLAEYLHELSTFPNSKYDDQVDSTSQALDWIKGALRSSNVLNYNFRGLALERCRSGCMPAAIAEEFRLPLDLVRSWIDEEQRRPPQQALAVMEMLKHANLDFCARCGGELGYNIPISSWGNCKYHPECLRKMLSRIDD
jgi:predicted phage terminase large subunit-like protein